MYVAGQGFSYSPFNRKHPREQQWRVGVQRQLSPNMSVEAYYWGEWGDHLAVSQKLAGAAGAVLEHHHGPQ